MPRSHKGSYDILMVGGGLAGMALALTLARAGIRVGVIERAPLDAQATRSFDVRTTAISAGSIEILTRAGIWPLVAQAACPITDIEILDGPRMPGTWPVKLAFTHDVPMGYIVDNLDLRTAMATLAAGAQNLTMIAPAEVADITTHPTQVDVTLNDGRILTASLLIGADGRGSYVRDAARIRTRGWPYDHTAIVSTITHTGAHNNIAIEHFLATGPFAVLPFTQDDQGRPRSAIVWSERPAAAKRVMGMDDQTFATALQARLPDRYGEVIQVGKRGAFPLSLQHAEAYIAPRTALIGDAAHGIHPIAGQGLNVGFRDVACLSDLLIAAKGDDYGGDTILQAYQSARRSDVTGMIAATDLLTWLFGSRLPGIPPLRKLGLRAVAALPPIKRFFIRRAMGA